VSDLIACMWSEVHRIWKYASLTIARATCDSLVDGRGDLTTLYLAQSLAPVPNGIDANDCQCVKPNGN
jgi:hypothetical protein